MSSNIFYIYKENNQNTINQIISLKESFNIYIFIFSSIWFLVKGFYVTAILLFSINIIIYFIFSDLAILINLSISFIIASNYHLIYDKIHMLENIITKKNNKKYILSSLILAKNEIDAKLIYLKNYQDIINIKS